MAHSAVPNRAPESPCNELHVGSSIRQRTRTGCHLLSNVSSRPPGDPIGPSLWQTLWQTLLLGVTFDVGYWMLRWVAHLDASRQNART